MSEPSNRRLDSWKEIAGYLRCDERTAMRWQKTGLPVHHRAGSGRGRVFAYTADLDAWLAGSKPGQIAGPEPGSTPTAFASRLARIPRLVQAGIIAAAAIGLFVVVSLIFKASTVAPLATVVLGRNGFDGLDAEGRTLWSHRLPAGSPHLPDGLQPRLDYIGDLSGDGHRVALTTFPFPEPPIDHKANEREIFCFSETGNLLWNLNPNYTLSFNAGQFGPPWHIRRWVIYKVAGQSRIAVVLTHEIWWPSLVVVLDSQGRETGRFVNAGHIFSLVSMESASRPLLLAGGVNNAGGPSAFLAVLDGANPSGTSPEDPESEFGCKNCPPGHPLRYFVFPRSEMNVITMSHFNKTSSIRREGSTIEAETTEVGPEQHVGVEGMFEFNDDFSLVRAAWSDGYAELHRELEREGKLHHSWKQCPDRFGPPLIRAWDPQHGWTDLHPNPSR